MYSTANYKYNKFVYESTKMDLKRLKRFMEERPALKPEGVGKEAGLPVGYMKKIMDGTRSLNDSQIQRLLPVLKKYGYK